MKSKAEEILGAALMRSIQRRMPESGTLFIPSKGPKNKGGRPPKIDRNREIIEAFESGEKQVVLAERFGLTQGRISAIVKAKAIS